MDLTVETSVIWTRPATYTAIGAALEIGDIDKLPEPSEDDKTRRKELQKKLTDLDEYRATFRTLSVLSQGRYRELLRAGHDWFLAEFGVTQDAAIDDEAHPDHSHRMQVLLSITHWARVLASLIKLEHRKRPMIGNGAEPKWKQIQIPEEWSDPATFLTTVPGSFTEAMHGAANEVNPGLWFVSRDETVKNYGGARAGA